MDRQIKQSMTAILACVRQTKGRVPVDLTMDNTPAWPTFRSVWRSINTISTDFNGSGRNPTITVVASRGFKIDTLWVTFDLPPIVARDINDRVAFDSLPGINILANVEGTIQGHQQIETVTNTTIIQRLLNYFGPKLFRVYAEKYFGGYYDPIVGYRGPLQQMSGIQRANIVANNPIKNEIFPKIHIMIPVPLSLFFNPELYPFIRAADAPIDLKFTFKPYTSVVSYTKPTILPDLAGELTLLHVNAMPLDSYLFYNKCPYGSDLQNQDPYYIVDHGSDFYIKTWPGSQELKLQTKSSLTTRLQCFVSPRMYESNEVFFGNTIDESVNLQLGGMFSTGPVVPNPGYTINLNTGLFVSTGTATSGNLQVEGWSAGGTSCRIKWTRTQTSSSVVTLKCSVPLDSFGTLYLDLATYYPSASTSGFTSILQSGIFFLCSEISLNIQPYNAATSQDDINTREVPGLSNNAMKKLARGFFSFNPNVGGANQHAFYNISNYVRSPLLTSENNYLRKDFAFDFFASRPLPDTHTMNVLLDVDTVKIVKNQHYFWDLDCKWPIRIVEVSLEKQGSSNVETYTRDELELYRNATHAGEPTRWDAALDIDWNFKSRLNPREESNGYMDMSPNLLPSYVVKLETIKMYYDGVELTDTQKEYATPREFTFYSLQWTLRMYQLYQNRIRQVRNSEQIEPFNRSLLTTILVPNGWTSLDLLGNQDYPVIRGGDDAANDMYNKRSPVLHDFSERGPMPPPPPPTTSMLGSSKRTYDEMANNYNNSREYVSSNKIMRNSNILDRMPVHSQRYESRQDGRLRLLN